MHQTSRLRWVLRGTLTATALSAASLSLAAHAAVNPFVAPAHAVCQAMAKLEQDVTRAVADRAVTPAEKAVLVKQATNTLAAADRLVAAQGAPAAAALATALHHFNANTTATRGPFLVQTLAAARAKVWTQAKHDLQTNPFAHLRGFAKLATGVFAKKSAAHGTSWVVAADLAQPRMRILSNKLQMRGANFVSVRVDENAKATHAQAAINGDFFSNRTPLYRPSGYTKTNDQVWPGTESSHFEPAIAWNGQHAVILPPRKAAPAWAKHVISARPLVLEAGRVVTQFSEPEKAARSRRTGVGLSADGRVLYFVAATSATATEIGKLLRGAGARDGFTMDAGGSAQLYVSGQGLAQPSSDPGRVRRVANVLMVRFQ